MVLPAESRRFHYAVTSPGRTARTRRERSDAQGHRECSHEQIVRDPVPPSRDAMTPPVTISVQAMDRSWEASRSLTRLQRMLVGADGTLTHMLEAYADEPVEFEKL